MSPVGQYERARALQVYGSFALCEALQGPGAQSLKESITQKPSSFLLLSS